MPRPVRIRRDVSRGAHGRRWSFTFFKAAATFAVAIGLSLSAVGGTYALWNSSTPVPLVASGATNVTIKAGTATLAVGGTPTLSALYPGGTSRTSFTVANTGAVALVVSVQSLSNPGIPLTQNLTLGLDADSTATPCTSPTASWTSAFGASPTGSANVTLAAGSSTTYCLSATLSDAAPTTLQSASTSFTLTLSGTQQ